MKSGGTKSLRKKSVDVPVVAVTGGKGGTGKTTIAVNLAVGLSMKGSKVMLVDADVDGPCCAALLGTKLNGGEDVNVFKPVIDPTRCTKCGKCVEICREHALVGLKGQTPTLLEELCSGCKACRLVCESDAIKKGEKAIGKIYVMDSNGIKLVVGELKPSEPRSPLVARATMLRAAEELKESKFDIMVVDTAPGIHNAIAQALWDADLALAVTEPTPLGVHDLSFMLDLAQELGLPTEIVLNKADIPGGLTNEVMQLSRGRGVKIVAEIPMNDELLRSYVSGLPLMRKLSENPAARVLSTLVSHVHGMFVK